MLITPRLHAHVRRGDPPTNAQSPDGLYGRDGPARYPLAVQDVPAPERLARFEILGPLEVRLGDRPVMLRRVKEKTLLGLLVLHANEVVSLDHLAGGLWEDVDLRPPATLRVHMSRLRRSLAELGVAAPPLVASGRGYVFEVPREAIDAHHFARLASEGRRQLRSGE